MTKTTAFIAAIRAVQLARHAAERGQIERARTAWVLACELSAKCGGLSGPATGGVALLLEQGGRSYTIFAPSSVR